MLFWRVFSGSGRRGLPRFGFPLLPGTLTAAGQGVERGRGVVESSTHVVDADTGRPIARATALSVERYRGEERVRKRVVGELAQLQERARRDELSMPERLAVMRASRERLQDASWQTCSMVVDAVTFAATCLDSGGFTAGYTRAERCWVVAIAPTPAWPVRLETLPPGGRGGGRDPALLRRPRTGRAHDGTIRYTRRGIEHDR